MNHLSKHYFIYIVILPKVRYSPPVLLGAGPELHWDPHARVLILHCPQRLHQVSGGTKPLIVVNSSFEKHS